MSYNPDDGWGERDVTHEVDKMFRKPRDNEPSFTYFGTVERTTEKAVKFNFVDAGIEEWLPKSQILFMSAPDENGERSIEITDWIRETKGIPLP